MENKNFLGVLALYCWIITFTLISAGVLIAEKCIITNPNYKIHVLIVMLINAVCFVYLITNSLWEKHE